MKKTRISLLFAGAALLAWGCDSQLPGLADLARDVPDFGDGVVGDPHGDGDPSNDGSHGSTDFAGGGDNTHDHDQTLGGGDKSPFEALQEREKEGPPEVRSRLHSCQKMQIAALRNTLVALGVDPDSNGDPATAGQLLREGADALGGANYASRTGESISWTNSGASKAQDIFVMAAPEIIAALPTAPQCQVDGVGPEMFDASDNCNLDAISCLMGKSATANHVAICNAAVRDSDTIEQGKVIAVAAILAAAHTCE